MIIRVYNQNEITRKQIHLRVVSDILALLEPYKIWEKTNTQTMQPNDNFIDVEYNASILGANYVSIVDGVRTTFYFVDDKKQISQNVLRIFISIDSLTTFYRPDTMLINGKVKKTNAPQYVNNSLTMSIDNVVSPKSMDYVDGSGTGDTLYPVAIFEVTQGDKTGKLFYASFGRRQVNGQLERIEDFLLRMAQMDRVKFNTGSSDESATGAVSMVFKNWYVVPARLLRTSNTLTNSTFFEKGDNTGRDHAQTWEGSPTQTVSEIQSSFETSPECNYRIGTYTSYAELTAPAYKGVTNYTLRLYYTMYELHFVIVLFGCEYDITPGFELPLMDSVRALENSQKRSNAVIANALSLLGQGVATGASFASGNFLGGILGLGNLANNAQSLYNFANQRVEGGVLLHDNAGLFNLLHVENLTGVWSIKNTSPMQETIITQKGYNMIEEYNVSKLEGNYYYEIIADEVEGVELRYEDDFIQRLANGVVIIL